MTTVPSDEDCSISSSSSDIKVIVRLRITDFFKNTM